MDYQTSSNSHLIDVNNQAGCTIIRFPNSNSVNKRTEMLLNLERPGVKIILGSPGTQLPDFIPDFRPYLQRNGLILLSWEKKLTEIGSLYTVYWVTSSGIHRYYASQPLFVEDLMDALPDRKSYAAEDGIDFYGEKSPLYMVHVAPELMMSSRDKISQRPLHIKKLKSLGVQVDFEYPYTLTRERRARTQYAGQRA